MRLPLCFCVLALTVFAVKGVALGEEGPLLEASPTRPRNVILLIGDGMGPQQLGLLFAYAHHGTDSPYEGRRCAIERLASVGKLALVRTEPHGALVVDSAAAATQLATGQWAGSEMIGVNYQGERATSVVEFAKQAGKATGLVSDTRITHATPAAFAAHQPHRSMESEIASDMLETQVDVLLSGGLRYWVPMAINKRDSAAFLSVAQLTGGVFEPKSKRNDNRNLLLEARNQGYQLAFDRWGLKQLKPGRALGLFASSSLGDSMQERRTIDSSERSEPTLREMTATALRLLSQDPEGFFLMVEGGQIDWAGHNNDAGTMLAELLRFDATVGLVLEWAAKRDDTLVLVTADHETGSFGMSYSGANLPAPRKLPGKAFEKAPFAPNYNFATPQLLDSLFKQPKSFYEIFLEFDALETEQKTAESLMELVNKGVSPFAITLDDATAILRRSPNRNHVAGHPYLDAKTLPYMPEQEAFYVYGENLRMNHLGHILATQQNVVWGTGTHTNTPVAIIGQGPGADRFNGILHATEVGQRIISLVRDE